MLNSKMGHDSNLDRDERIGIHRQLTLGQHLREWADRYGDNTAIVEEARESPTESWIAGRMNWRLVLFIWASREGTT